MLSVYLLQISDNLKFKCIDNTEGGEDEDDSTDDLSFQSLEMDPCIANNELRLVFEQQKAKT